MGECDGLRTGSGIGRLCMKPTPLNKKKLRLYEVAYFLKCGSTLGSELLNCNLYLVGKDELDIKKQFNKYRRDYNSADEFSREILGFGRKSELEPSINEVKVEGYNITLESLVEEKLKRGPKVYRTLGGAYS